MARTQPKITRKETSKKATESGLEMFEHKDSDSEYEEYREHP